MVDFLLFCSICQKINKVDKETDTERQLFKRYVDDTIGTASGESDNFIRKLLISHIRVEFNLKATFVNGNFVFLDMNIIINSRKKINYEW